MIQGARLRDMFDDLDDRLRKTVKARVDARGWSLRETAARLTEAGWTVTHPMVQRLLNGTRKMTVSEWLSLSHALSEPPLRLLLPRADERLRVVGRKMVDGDRFMAWIVGETPLDTVPNPDHFRRAAGRPSTRGQTEYGALLRHLADVYDAGRPGDRGGVAWDVLRCTTGVIDHDRARRRRRKPSTTEQPATMANFDLSDWPPKRTRKASTTEQERPNT